MFTVGANSSKGSFIREDDARAKFSSRGPAFPLQIAKPDILAGGVGIESTAAAGSKLYQQGAAAIPSWLIPGAFPTAHLPYLVLTGTSQAAAAVSGVAAQMLQANPALTPNLMKAILEYTSEDHAGYSPLEQGAGFLNALGAVRLSRFYATAREGQHVPVEPIWSKHFIWGNHEMSGGLMLPKANAWKPGVLWGSPKTAGSDGDNIVWGTSCGSDDCGDNIVWGTSDGDNIVWGTADGDNIVWGTAGDGDNIVWGTSTDGDNIVWGTDCGGADCDNVVWGMAGDGDNIVWGTATDGDNIVWGTAGDGDNIVWGTAAMATTSCGARPPMATTSCGARPRRRQHRVGHGQRRRQHRVGHRSATGDNIVWGTDGDNIGGYGDCVADRASAVHADGLVPAVPQSAVRRRGGWLTSSAIRSSRGTDVTRQAQKTDAAAQAADVTSAQLVIFDRRRRQRSCRTCLTDSKLGHRDCPRYSTGEVVGSDWRSGLPLLRGALVTLRELRASDAASLCALLTTEEVARFVSPPPTTVDGFERFIGWTLAPARRRHLRLLRDHASLASTPRLASSRCGSSRPDSARRSGAS